MDLSTSDKIRLLLRKRGMKASQLAAATGQSPQNLHHKLARSNFAEVELKKIAQALGCTYATTWRLDDTGEEL